MKVHLRQTDVLVDTTSRSDPSVPLIPKWTSQTLPSSIPAEARTALQADAAAAKADRHRAAIDVDALPIQHFLAWHQGAAQLLQRLPHHRIGALEHPAAADREQRVGGEYRLFGIEHIGDVVERMAGRFQHPRQQAADLDHIAIDGAQVDIGDLRRLVVRCHDAALVFLLQLGDAADMVVMVMGDQDVRQRPALALQRLDDGGCFRGVDAHEIDPRDQRGQAVGARQRGVGLGTRRLIFKREDLAATGCAPPAL